MIVSFIGGGKGSYIETIAYLLQLLVLTDQHLSNKFASNSPTIPSTLDMLLLDNDQHRLGETVNLAELKLYMNDNWMGPCKVKFILCG